MMNLPPLAELHTINDATLKDERAYLVLHMAHIQQMLDDTRQQIAHIDTVATRRREELADAAAS